MSIQTLAYIEETGAKNCLKMPINAVISGVCGNCEQIVNIEKFLRKILISEQISATIRLRESYNIVILMLQLCFKVQFPIGKP